MHLFSSMISPHQRYRSALFPARGFMGLFWIMILIAMQGCGSDKSDAPLRYGEFTAFTVAGLEYSCYNHQGLLTRKGATNDAGRFYYRIYEDQGGSEHTESIQFALGGIKIGDTLKPVFKMSPLDFDTSEVMSDETINIAAFLQTLDEERPVTRKSELDLSGFDCPDDDDDDFDCDCTDDVCDVTYFPNGIAISREVREAISRKAAEGLTINFNQPADDFQKDENVLGLLSYLNGQHVFKEAEPRTLVGAEQAITNLKDALALNKALPVIFINLGDQFTCGVQSGKGNVHEYTQKNGFPRYLATYANYATDFFNWYPADIDLKQFFEKSLYFRQRMTTLIESITDDETEPGILNHIHYENRAVNGTDYVDYLYLPTLLGVDGATTETLIRETTGAGNTLLDALMEPIFEPEYNNAPVSQLEAAEFIAARHPDKQKIVTLFIGLNDIFGDIIGNGGTDLTLSAISAFLEDTANKHDLNSMAANIQEIVDRLTAIPDTHLFIGTLPHVTSFGAFFSETDLEHLSALGGQKAKADVTALASGQYVGFLPFMNRTPVEETEGSGLYARLIPDLETSIANALGKEADAAILNTAITDTLAVSDGYSLSAEEAQLLNDRVDQINAFIESLGESSEEITIVDLKTAVFDKLDVDYGRILDDDFDLKEDSETKKYVKANYLYITTDGDPDSADDPDLSEWEYKVLSRRFGGGFYSLDGIHPSNIGYLMIAKAYIKAINDAKLGMEISDITDAIVYSTYQSDPYQDDDGDGFAPGPRAVVDKTDFYDSADDKVSCGVINPFLTGLSDCSDSKGKTYPPFIAGKDLCDD